MPVKLPDRPLEAILFSPKTLLLYGMPKIGKTELLVKLSATDNLILQGDPRGNDMYTCLSMNLTNYEDWKDLISQILAQGPIRMAQGKKGVELYPYKYISIDNISKVQEIARQSLTAEYLVDAKKKVKKTETQIEALADPKFVITDLPYAAGTYQLRERVKQMIEDLARVCHKLIIIAHVKDKEMTTMANEVVKVTEIALDGKLGEIVASRVDAIGYLFRNRESEFMVSFKSNERSTMGARFKYLAGKTFPFSWEAIFPDEFGLPVPEK